MTLNNIIQFGLSISVLTNCISVWNLMRAFKENEILYTRFASLQWDVMTLKLQGREHGAGVQGVAENTEIGK